MEDLLEEWLSAPAAYPAARCAIEALDPIVREELRPGIGADRSARGGNALRLRRPA